MDQRTNNIQAAITGDGTTAITRRTAAASGWTTGIVETTVGMERGDETIV